MWHCSPGQYERAGHMFAVMCLVPIAHVSCFVWVCPTPQKKRTTSHHYGWVTDLPSLDFYPIFVNFLKTLPSLTILVLPTSSCHMWNSHSESQATGQSFLVLWQRFRRNKWHTEPRSHQCCFRSCAFIKIYLLQPRNISQERERGGSVREGVASFFYPIASISFAFA